MSERFDTILTNAGLAAVANASITQKQVNFAKLAVGDSNGAYYTPTQEATALRNQVWIGNASSVTTDPNNPNWIVVKAVIPGTVGGFEIREIGIFDENNVLLAIGKLPLTYKPIFSEGSTKELTIKAIFEVTNTSAVTLKIDTSVIYASEKYVDEKVATIVSGLENVQQKLTKHEVDYVKHPFHTTPTFASNIYSVTLDTTITDYVDGMGLVLKCPTASTTNVVIKVGSLPQKVVLNANGNLVKNFKKDAIYAVRYNATVTNPAIFTGTGAFILQGEGGEYGNATAAEVAKGRTFGTDDGLKTGTAIISKLPPFIPNKQMLYTSGTLYQWNHLQAPIFSVGGLFGITATNSPANLDATKIFRLTTSSYQALFDSDSWTHIKGWGSYFRSGWHLVTDYAPSSYQLFSSDSSTYISIFQITSTAFNANGNITAAKPCAGGLSGVQRDGYLYTIERAEGGITRLHKLYAPFQGGAGSLIQTWSVALDSLYASGYNVQLIDGYVVFTRRDLMKVIVYDLTLTSVKVIDADYGNGQDALMTSPDNIRGLLYSSIVYDKTTGAFGQKNMGLNQNQANVHTYPYNWVTSNG